MWSLYLTAKGTHSRPSDLLCVDDPWAAYMLDSAVTTLGVTIENAAQEQVNVGGDQSPKWQAKYSLHDLLTPGFVIGDDAGDELPVGADGLIYDEV